MQSCEIDKDCCLNVFKNDCVFNFELSAYIYIFFIYIYIYKYIYIWNMFKKKKLNNLKMVNKIISLMKE